MKGCVLGFTKLMDPQKYKMAIQRLKVKAGNKDKFTIDYKAMCVFLLSIAEKARPVTIVDILRREKAINLLRIESKRPAPPRPKPKGSKQHAIANIPPEHLRDKKLNSLTDKDIVYSYNLYVVLDQLSRLNREADYPEGSGDKIRLTPQELEILKQMVDDNDEDLLVYFEEYVEKSGPVYIESGQAWKAFCRFGKMAKAVHARSKRFGDAKEGKKGQGDEDGEGDDAKEDEEEMEGEEGEGDDDDEGAGPESDEDDDAPGGAAARISIGYGEAMEDEDGVLDLQDWSECVLCGEPVDNSWERCPTCGKKNPSGKQS